jgi:hypothetical protein
MTDKEPQMSNKIAGYELTAAGAAGSTFVSNYFQLFLAILNPFHPCSFIQIHFHPCQKFSRHILSFVAIYSPFQQLSFLESLAVGLRL